MSVGNVPLHRFNAGEVSNSALVRTDVDRVRLSANEQINWMPRKIGSMTIRPGLAYLGSTKSDAKAQPIPFVSSMDAKAILEFTDSILRVWIDDALLARVSVSTAVTSGTFSASTGWTLTTSGGTSTVTGGELRMSATAVGGEGKAIQQVTVAVGDRSIEHALRIIVTRGPVQFQVGSSSGGEQYVKETTLLTGTHSIAFTPTNDFYIQFKTTTLRECRIDSCTVEASGTVELPTPYTSTKLDLIRWAQSADVMFLACAGLQQRRVERRAQRSWSIVLYRPVDGPFMPIPQANVQMTPNGLTGNITITADKPYFRSGHVGALFRLFQTSEQIDTDLVAQNTFTDPIRISGTKKAQPPQFSKPSKSTRMATSTETGETGDTLDSAAGSSETSRTSMGQLIESLSSDSLTKNADNHVVSGGGTRKFTYSITNSGGFNGTVSLQRSFDGEDVGFTTVRKDKTKLGRISVKDDFDNSIVWWRAGIETGNFGTSGGSQTASISLRYPHGGHAGIVRITAFSSSTSVSAEVLNKLASKTATREWLEGAWSDRQGWPTSVGFFGGRLWWFGNDTAWASVSDAYESFDYEMDGDASPIIRSIGEGPVQGINGMLGLRRPILLGAISEMAIRSNAFDEPLTPTNFNINEISSHGSANVQAVRMDGRGIFIHRSKRRVFQLLYSLDRQDYTAVDLMALHPDLGSSDFIKIAVQRQPETMVHVIRDDGTACVLLLEPDEEVVAWWRVVTDGVIENVVVLPGTPEDQVYYVVKRTINGSTKRYLERFARLDECLGTQTTGTLNKLADSHISYSGSAVTTITGLTHLEGETVVAWGGSGVNLPRDLGSFTVTGGQITGLPISVTTAIIGLSYDATYTSTKLAYAAQKGTALLQNKRIPKIGLICQNTHYQAIQYGSDSSNLSYMPLIENGVAVTSNTVNATYDEKMFPLDGTWDSDARLYLKATAPRPATICAAVIQVETRES